MDVFQFHAQAFATAQQLTGNCPVFTWDGVDWLAIPNGALLKKNLSVGGFSLDFDLKLFALVQQFIDNGTAEDAASLKNLMLETPLEYFGDSYKIVSVNINTGGQQIEILCNALSQGA